VTFMQVDHSTVGGNQQLADRVRDALSGLDVLVNNVGASTAIAGRRPTGTRGRSR
jgi:NAD(P)-dependent dehydrogenase (short-subunit alcohol dehydrogenase family)